MAKTPRTGGENRGRRVADRRRAAQPEGAGPETAAASMADDRKAGGGGAGTRREPTHDDIARRAYEIFSARGGTHGYHIEDWLQAERELRVR